MYESKQLLATTNELHAGGIGANLFFHACGFLLYKLIVISFFSGLGTELSRTLVSEHLAISHVSFVYFITVSLSLLRLCHTRLDRVTIEAAS